MKRNRTNHYREIIASSIIVILISVVIRMGVKSELPTCETMSDIGKYDGASVELIGQYSYPHDTKGGPWAFIILKDGTHVVYKNQPSTDEVERFNNHTVRIVGTIYSSGPEIDPALQNWFIPMIVDVKSIEII